MKKQAKTARTTSNTPTSESFLAKYGIWLIILLALLLRIPQLNSSFWLDEAAQALESTRPLSQQLHIATDFQPPLFHLIVHFFALGSHNEAWLRTTSLIAGLVMIWGTFYIAKTLTNYKVATLTAVLLATNSFHIFYSQELRPYALTGMWAVLGWLAVINMVQKKTSRYFSYSALAFIFCSIAGVYSTYLYPFAFLGQLLFLASRRQHRFFVQAIIAGIIVSASFVPWLPSFKEQLDIGQQLRTTTHGWENVVSTPQLKALQLVFGKFIFGVIDLDFNALFITLTMFILITILLLGWSVRRHFNITVAFVIACWFIIPVFLIWLFSFFLPVIQPKRVLFTLPAVTFLLSVIIFQGWQWKMKITSAILAATVLATHLYGTGAYYFNRNYHREDWRTVISQIDQQYSPSNTIVVFGFEHPFSPWDWYRHKPYRTILTGTATKTEYSQVEIPMTPALEFENVIVFDYLRDLTDPNRLIEQYLEQYNYQQTQLFEAPQLGFVRVYTKGEVFAHAK